MHSPSEPQILHRKAAAHFLGLAEQTLRNWVTLGKGPRPLRPRGPRSRVYYAVDELEAWRDHGRREARHG